MEDFPSNSQKNRDEPKNDPKIKHVVEGTVVRRKKPLGKKFKDFFFGADAKENLRNVLYDVLIPQAKDMIFEAGKEALDRRIFGESRYGGYRRGGRSGSSGSHIRYDKVSSYSQNTPRDRDEPRTLSHRARSKHDFGEVIIGTRREAEEVIVNLFDIIEQYDVASLYNLYELLNIEGTYVDKKWGWTDMQGASVSNVRGGYLLNLPKPQPLD